MSKAAPKQAGAQRAPTCSGAVIDEELMAQSRDNRAGLFSYVRRKLVYAQVKGEGKGFYVCSACHRDFKDDAMDALNAFESHRCKGIAIVGVNQIEIALSEKTRPTTALGRVVELLQSLGRRLTGSFFACL